MDRSIFNRLGFTINQTSWAIRRRIQNVIVRQGSSITPEQWILISLLYEKPLITQTELANLMFKDKASVNRMTKILKRNELIRLSPDRNDRRKSLLELSAKGRRLQEELLPFILEEYHKLVNTVPKTEKKLVMDTLTRICNTATD
jgi:DNA-binding MarR family transcriptional regulator